MLLSLLFLGQVAGLSLQKVPPSPQKRRLRLSALRMPEDDGTGDAVVGTAMPKDLRVRLKDVLKSGDGSAGSLGAALMGLGDEALRPLVGNVLAPRVTELVAAQCRASFATKATTRFLGDFEDRALDLMAAERWIEAHDVLSGELQQQVSNTGGGGGATDVGGPFPHMHEATLAARLLEGVCQHQLACPGGLVAALAAHEAEMVTIGGVGSAGSAPTMPCGCVVSVETVEPFADLARALVCLDAGDANAALGHALAASLARPRPALEATAALFATRAEASLELLVFPADVAEEAGAAAASSPSSYKDFPASQLPESGNADNLTDAEDAVGASEELPSLASLHALVGLDEVKERCQNLKDALALERERGDDPRQKHFSLVLTGNPGTGKSSVAACYGQLLGELGVVPAGRVARVTGAQLQDGGVKALEEFLEAFDKPGNGELGVGDTVEVRRQGKWGNVGRVIHRDADSVAARPQFKGTYDVHFGQMLTFELANGTRVVRRDHDYDIGVRRQDMRASGDTGGVLIIDDAHQLDPGQEKAARQVLYRLTEEMDARGGKLAVVLSGYEKGLDEKVLGFNNGALASRLNRRRHALPDFTDAELIEMLQARLRTTKPNYRVGDAKHLRIAARRVGKGRGNLGFGNARAVQALVDTASERQTSRVVSERKAGLNPDIFEFQRSDLLGEQAKLLDAKNSAPLRALYEMEGLEAVKSSVSGLLKLAESNAQREDQELPLAETSLNRVFLGNPGTGKTTVAALYGRVLKELGLLSRGDVVLATPADLIGSALGQSEEKTNALLDKAEGCVLVIDEAYGLDPNGAGSFGGSSGGSGGGDPFKTAVVDTLVSRVQGDAGANRCVLLLGYRKEMERFIRKGNPGLARRFQLENAFEFHDYDDQALLRILLRSVAKRGKAVSFEAAKQAVRKDLAKKRMRPNFGNAGAVDNSVSQAVVRAEARLQGLPPAQRVTQNELLLEDFVGDEKPHMADPSLVFEGLIGVENIKTRLAEYQAVIEAASNAGRDPLDDLALTFCFQGSPGTGKTTVARRFGMLFEALGVLPSAEVIQVSASDFSTGFVGQTGAKTRDIFDSARGAVLFIDEAYRLYDPNGRSYMQEAVDEIVTLLTEEAYRNKMVVIFAGYSGQMTELLNKVNPGLKSRVSDVIDFPDFSASAAAELASSMLAEKALKLPTVDGSFQQSPGSQAGQLLEPWTTELVNAPRWANGRDVETFVRRVAVECATRKTSDVTVEALDAALDTLLQMKGGAASPREAVDLPSSGSRDDDFVFDTSAAWQPPPSAFIADTEKAVVADDGEGDEDDESDDDGGVDDGIADALEEAIVALGYDADLPSRQKLASLLAKGAYGLAPFPEELASRVARTLGGNREAVDAALTRQAKPALAAVQAAITYEIRRREELEKGVDEDGKKKEEEDDEAFIKDRLQSMGPCPAGFSWYRSGNGWRCGGGSHFVYDDDPILKRDSGEDF